MPSSPTAPLSNVAAPSTPNAPLFHWLERRATGVLLHPTSFPDPFGIGSLDEQTVDNWLRFLAEAGMTYWQTCPLGPTGYGDSPYQCFSSFAGNPYLIDLGALLRLDLISESDVAQLRALPKDRVDFGWLYSARWPVLFEAFRRFKAKGSPALPYGDFADFRKQNREWLESFALFLALKDHHRGKPWWEWPDNLRFFSRVDQSALPAEVRERAEAHSFFQYLFFGQWSRVRESAKKHGISIIGDAPIFVARDSADVWANPELFQLDRATGRPLFVAGVPPDYFSADGQLWGNPLYDWAAHKKENYRWWLRRLAANFVLCDVLRIDHFRAFDSFWCIPASAKSAKTGTWELGPGIGFFQKVKDALPEAKLIAEDLGELTPSVRELRDRTGLPGMTILQFAFGSGSDNLYLPHNLRANSVVYPGTHDNDTTLGWYRQATEGQRDHLRQYFRISGDEISWDFIRAAYASVSTLAVIPLQDFLSLGPEGRFNTPGVAAGNWQWRYSADQLHQLHANSAAYLHSLGDLYGRLPTSKQPGS
ncbi:MAG TPA: 4-alpha-glucanotransferase [Opitutaceae bacterium]|nr:4-alpha-glucanotransferase [Opitutaceae bacterium]